MIAKDRHSLGGHAVLEIRPGGAVHSWSEAHPAQHIRDGDVIVTVNGAAEFDQMMEQFGQSLCCTLEVLRPTAVGGGSSDEEAKRKADEVHEFLRDKGGGADQYGGAGQSHGRGQAPPRPKSGFGKFSAEIRAKLKEERPELVTDLIAEAWAVVPEERKAQMQKEYEAEMKIWKPKWEAYKQTDHYKTEEPAKTKERGKVAEPARTE